MNRFTRYVAEKHNMKPDSAYPWLPYEVSKGIVLEHVEHDAQNCLVKEYYNVGNVVYHIGKDGQVDSQDFI